MLLGTDFSRTVVSFKLSGNTNLAIQKNDDLVDQYLKARENHFKILLLQFSQMIGFLERLIASIVIIFLRCKVIEVVIYWINLSIVFIILLVIQSVEKLIIGLESLYDVLTSIEKIGQVVDKEIESPTLKYSTNQPTLELDQVSYRVENRKKGIINNSV